VPPACIAAAQRSARQGRGLRARVSPLARSQRDEAGRHDSAGANRVPHGRAAESGAGRGAAAGQADRHLRVGRARLSRPAPLHVVSGHPGARVLGRRGGGGHGRNVVPARADGHGHAADRLRRLPALPPRGLSHLRPSEGPGLSGRRRGPGAFRDPRGQAHPPAGVVHAGAGRAGGAGGGGGPRRRAGRGSDRQERRRPGRRPDWQPYCPGRPGRGGGGADCRSERPPPGCGAPLRNRAHLRRRRGGPLRRGRAGFRPSRLRRRSWS